MIQLFLIPMVETIELRLTKIDIFRVRWLKNPEESGTELTRTSVKLLSIG